MTSSDLDDRAVAPARRGARRPRAATRCIGGGEGGDLTRREQRRERAALRAPVLALGGQQAVAEARASARAAAARPCGSWRRCRGTRAAPRRDRWPRRACRRSVRPIRTGRSKCTLAPDLERIAPEGEDRRQGAARRRARARIGRNEEPGERRCRHRRNRLRRTSRDDLGGADAARQGRAGKRAPMARDSARVRTRSAAASPRRSCRRRDSRARRRPGRRGRAGSP